MSGKSAEKEKTKQSVKQVFSNNFYYVFFKSGRSYEQRSGNDKECYDTDQRSL